MRKHDATKLAVWLAWVTPARTHHSQGPVEQRSPRHAACSLIVYRYTLAVAAPSSLGL